MPTIDESFAGREVKLAVGEKLVIQLMEKRAAGFQWRRTGELPSPLGAESDVFSIASGAPPGSSGVHVWHFEGKGQGNAKLEFEYGRSWEDPSKPDRKFAVTIQVA